jgi:(S)-mandelate dehydrogenase
VEAAGGRLAVLVDSGFRRGADVAKAIALGAKAVLVGRGPLYGVSAAGQKGAARALEIYRDEIDRILAMIGCPGVEQLDRSYLSLPE